MLSAAKKARSMGGILALALALGAAGAAGPSPAEKPKDVPGLLLEIHREVGEMEAYPGEEFVRRDFSLGEDDDDTNRNHHVGILIQSLEEGAVMTIQITKLVPEKNNPRIRHGKDGRMIVCKFHPDRVEVTRSDYPEGELKAVLAEVLRAVVLKKSLLKK